MLRVINQSIEEISALVMCCKGHKVAQPTEQSHDCSDDLFIFPAHQDDGVLVWSLNTRPEEFFVQEQPCTRLSFARANEFPNVIERVTHSEIRSNTLRQRGVGNFRNCTEHFGRGKEVELTRKG